MVLVALVGLLVLQLLALLNRAAIVLVVMVIGAVLTALFNRWPNPPRKRKRTTKPYGKL